MFTASRFAVVSLLALTALTLSAGCAVDGPEEDAGQSEDALTDATCRPRADKKKAAHLKTCGGGASVAEAVACVAPHYATVNAYYRDLHSLEQSWDANVKAIVDDCVERKNACPADPQIEALVASGISRDKLPAKDCSAAIDKARRECSKGIEPMIVKANPNDPYLAKARQEGSVIATFAGKAAGCFIGEVGDALATAKCQTFDAQAVYDNEMRSCHGQCPAPTKGGPGPVACKPDGFTDIPSCGEIKTTFGTCTCAPTNFCRVYRAQQSEWATKAKAAGVKKILCDGGESYKTPQFTYDARGKANGVITVCQAN